MLTGAGVPIEVAAPRVDEAALQESSVAEGLSPRDVADLLAEAKAAKLAARFPSRLVLGADQTADLDGALLTKPTTPEAAKAQIAQLSGRRHVLHSAAVIFEGGRPVWRHIQSPRLHMRPLSPAYIDDYVNRHWPDLAGSVGGYRIEGEGARFFTSVTGDFFAVQGLPLLPLLDYLALRGHIAT